MGSSLKSVTLWEDLGDFIYRSRRSFLWMGGSVQLVEYLHPGKLTFGTPKMKAWKMIFFLKLGEFLGSMLNFSGV